MPTATSITVTIPSPLPPGERAVAAAVVRDETSAVMLGVRVEWSSSNATVARINPVTGVITTTAIGTTTIAARVGGVLGNAALAVTAATPAPAPAQLLDFDTTAIRLGAPPGALTLDYEQTTLYLGVPSSGPPPPPPQGVDADGNLTRVSVLPGTRLTTFKAWADGAINYGAIPAERRFTVVDAGNPATNGTALASAIASARAATGGHRVVILPDGFHARGSFLGGANADLTADVIIAPARVVAGTVVLERGIRNASTVPAWVPLLENVLAGSQGGVLWETERTAAAHRYRLVSLHLRTNSTLGGTIYTPTLIDHGQHGLARPVAPFTAVPGYLFLDHCWTGGRAFDSAGNWHQGGLGRVIFDCSTGFGSADGYNMEHGAVGLNGSDRGYWGGVWGQGPTWLFNLGGDSFGGIAFMYGGGDVPSDYPIHADFEVDLCHFRRAARYRHGSLLYGLAAGELDASGQPCPWAFKNLGEAKGGWRHRWHRTLWTEFYYDGQENCLGVKANNQGGSGRADVMQDFTIESVIVETVTGRGVTLIGGEGYGGGTVEGIQRLTFRNAYIKSGTGQAVALTPGPPLFPGSGAPGEITSTVRASDWSLTNLSMEPPAGVAPIHAEYGNNATLGGVVTYRRNVILTPGVFPTILINPAASEPQFQSYGLHSFFLAGTGYTGVGTGATTLTVNQNANRGEPGYVDNGAFTPTAYASDSAMGVERDATSGLLVHTAGSALLTLAAGERVGADTAYLAPLRAALLAGDVRAYITGGV